MFVVNVTLHLLESNVEPVLLRKGGPDRLMMGPEVPPAAASESLAATGAGRPCAPLRGTPLPKSRPPPLSNLKTSFENGAPNCEG